jgi:hypothetical protein
VIVTLLKPHTDAGLGYKPGDMLDVDESTAQWLIERGVAEAAPESEPKNPTRKGE